MIDWDKIEMDLWEITNDDPMDMALVLLNYFKKLIEEEFGSQQ